MLTRPAFLISLMVVDEQFSLLAHFVNLDKTYYFSIDRGSRRLDFLGSVLCHSLAVYESVFIWSLWNFIYVPTSPTASNSESQT